MSRSQTTWQKTVPKRSVFDVSSGSSSFPLPGFFDLQVNGCSGVDYSSENLTVESVVQVVDVLAKRGTTRHLPTIITNSFSLIERNLKILADARRNQELMNKAIPGIHIEGPYISREDGPRGAHDPAYIRNPDPDEFAAWQDAADGAIAMITLAPELKGALACIEKWTGEGVVVAIGHTAAEPACIREAAAAGARVSTHLGNGCSAMLPRHPNILWEQLAEDSLYASVIADGYHLPSAFIRTVLRTKPADKLLLISDITALAGSSPGRYSWGDIEVEISDSGRIGLAGTTFLAGAGHDLLHGIEHLVFNLHLPLEQVIPLCTTNPARLMGFEISAAEASAAEASKTDNSKAEDLAAEAFPNFLQVRLDREPGRLAIEKVTFGDRVKQFSH
jgi:N-acetylglucosamine-6-phosphate deacetylase